jgi:hypothetical protein
VPKRDEDHRRTKPSCQEPDGGGLARLQPTHTEMIGLSTIDMSVYGVPMATIYNDPNYSYCGTSTISSNSSNPLSGHTIWNSTQTYYPVPDTRFCSRCAATVENISWDVHEAFHAQVDLLEKLVRSMAARDIAALADGFLDLDE